MKEIGKEVKFVRLITCLAGVLALTASAAQAQNLPERLVPSEVARVSAPKEEVGGNYGGVIFTPELRQPATDGKYSQPYHVGCFVYPAQKSGGEVTAFARRFAVYVPDKESLPTAKRVARLLLTLYGLNRERMKFDHLRNAPTVEVWLTRSTGAELDADVGGEQFKNQIYIYNLFAERSGMEWVREVAHEYGHYALPGISGFTDPEEWGNGVLGERLYVQWLAEGLKAGNLKAEAVPFATPEEIGKYAEKQIIPLMRRFAREGVDARRFSKRDMEGMNAFVGLALYVDGVYGSEALRMGFSYASSSQGNTFLTGADFLRGVETSLNGATEITLRPALAEKGDRRAAFFAYVPRGQFQVKMEGAVRNWEFPTEAKAVYPQGKSGLIVNVGLWRKITLSLESSAAEPGSVVFQRRGTEVP